MRFSRFLKPLLLLGAAVSLCIIGYSTRQRWFPGASKPEHTESHEDPVAPVVMVIVSDQAQKNLGLISDQVKAQTVWRTITIPGMVVDRAGLSDRGVVAPVTGVVSEIHHTAGDAVKPGDVLFTLKILSESLHQSQSDLFKAAQDIKLAQANKQRLESAGSAIPQARILEVENQITRLDVAVRALRQDLHTRGLADSDIDAVTKGKFVNTLRVTVPERTAGHKPLISSVPARASSAQPMFEVQELKVELGQQVQAGQSLCFLANHQLLSIEGRAFRDELPLLERSVSEAWPVDVDFQEDSRASWPTLDQTFRIRHIANSIDPVNRTLGFYLPLENQSKVTDQQGEARLLWRFRPGQKVRLRVRVEEVKNVFVLPPEAVTRDGVEAFVFSQNTNSFERLGVHVLFQERNRVVIANDGLLPTFRKGQDVWTIPAIAQSAAAQLNRMTRSGSSGVPKGYHMHADGSIHKNHDEGE